MAQFNAQLTQNKVEQSRAVIASKDLKTRRVKSTLEKSLGVIVFSAQSIRNKMDEFRALMATEKPEIVGITESWIHTNARDFEEFEIPGYKMFKKDREGRGG